MAKKFIGIAMVVIAIIVFSTSCGSPEERPEAVISVESEVSTFDWHKTIYVYEKSVYSMVMEGLTRSNAVGKIEPGIADYWQVLEEGKLWRFKLRDSTWSDGRAVVAGDFVDGVKYALEPSHSRGFYSYLLYYIEGAQEYSLKSGSWDKVGIKAIDDKTLEIRLKNPVDYFDYLVSLPVYAPIRMDKVKEMGDNYGKSIEGMVYNGPFKIKSLSPAKDIYFVKNDSYWNSSRVKLNSVATRVVKSSGDSLKMFLNGEVDVSLYLTEEQKSKIIASKNGNVNQFADGSVWMVVFNCDNIVLNNKNIRKALSYAIDRKSLIETVAKQPLKPAMAIVPPNVIPGIDVDSDYREVKQSYFSDNNVEQARGLLKKGMSELRISKFPDMKILVNDEEEIVDNVREIKKMWKNNLGIDIDIKKVRVEEKAKLQNQGNYEMSFIGWGVDYPDPLNYLDAFTSSSPANLIRYSNFAYDELILYGKKNLEKKNRFEAFYKAEDILMNDMPVAPIYYRYVDYGVNSKLKGYSKGAYSPSLNLIDAEMGK